MTQNDKSSLQQHSTGKHDAINLQIPIIISKMKSIFQAEFKQLLQ